jgi:hypothetical protein
MLILGRFEILVVVDDTLNQHRGKGICGVGDSMMVRTRIKPSSRAVV